MKTGDRPPAEYVDNPVRRERMSQRPVPGRPAPHIDLRVIRPASIDRTHGYNRAEWHDFLDDLGRRNHGLGTAQALGSVAITYVSATNMNTMLRDRYQDAYHNPKQKPGLFRRIERSIQAFLAQQSADAYQDALEALQLGRMLDDGDDFDAEDWWEHPSADGPLTEDEKLALEEYRFGHLDLLVRGMQGDGSSERAYALDLGLNEFLFDEFHALSKYLRQTEHLNTQVLGSFMPHARVFERHDHTLGHPITYNSVGIPDRLPVDLPRTELQIIHSSLESRGTS